MKKRTLIWTLCAAALLVTALAMEAVGAVLIKKIVEIK